METVTLWILQLRQRRIKNAESYLPAGNIFGGIWRSFSGAAYWMVCNSCLGVASPLAKPASTQSQWRVGLELASRRWSNARTAPRRPRLDTSQSYFYDCELHTSYTWSLVKINPVSQPSWYSVLWLRLPPPWDAGSSIGIRHVKTCTSQ